ncbi:MAG: alcohol dehydrogenase catalytic domain-containing protein [Candidatus Bathyarchaeia archaeon]|jgi:2-desacetyl-2-hydroxyethyl bacteriochlorophyllide A dehydrogenase
MKAAVWYGGKDIRIEEIEKPRAGPSEVLIRVKAVGICGSEMHAYEGLSKRRVPPLVMGHEFAGIVEELGEGQTDIGVGDRVVVSPAVHCGACEECLSGRTNVCRARRHVGIDFPGAFAEYVTMPSHVCYRIPESAGFEEAALAEPLSVGTHATGIAKVTDEDTVLVLGCGIIGLSCLIAAREKARTTLVSDVLDSRLNFARLFGADATIDASTMDAVAQVQRMTSGRGVDVALEAVGLEQTARQAVSSVKEAGRVVLVGLFEEMARLNILQIALKEIQITGSYGRKDKDFRNALRLLETRGPTIRRLITHTFPLDRVSEAFETISSQKQSAIKVLLLP